MSKEVKQKDLGWSYIQYQVDKICNEISGRNFDVVVGISRGGLIPAVMISHRLKLPLLTMTVTLRDNLARVQSLKINKGEKALVVDDINDSGKTFSDIMDFWVQKLNIPLEELRERIRTVSLIERTGSSWAVDYTPKVLDTKQWVVFPWELII